jgi:hypothetical protein
MSWVSDLIQKGFGAQGQSYAASVMPPQGMTRLAIQHPVLASQPGLSPPAVPASPAPPPPPPVGMPAPQQSYIPPELTNYASSPAVSGVQTRAAGIGAMVGPAALRASASAPFMGPQAPFAKVLQGVGNYAQGLGFGASVLAAPAAPAAPAPVQDMAPAGVPQGPGRQLSPGPNGLAPMAELPPVAVHAPAPTARQVQESILANPHLPVSMRAALQSGLPRQPMPQEIAQQKLMQLYQDRYDNDIAQAMRLTDPVAQAAARENAYQRLEKFLRPLGIPGYGLIGVGQEDNAN